MKKKISVSTISKNSILCEFKRGQRELSDRGEKTARLIKNALGGTEERVKRGQRELPSCDDGLL